MRSLVIFLSAVIGCWAATGCTKPTPNLCCTDEADCAESGIPSGQTCHDGLACRGHMCVAEVCQGSADCNPTAPYCVVADFGLCAASCTTDLQCPGAAQDPLDHFCVGGSCAQCRVDRNDCAATTPVCAGGSCRGCVAHGECASHVCAADGTCADEGSIAHADPGGSTTGDCSTLAPCTLERALAVAPTRSYVLLAPGSYRNAATLTVDGKRSLIGDGPSRPTITNTAKGVIITIGSASDITFDHLQLSGATNPASGTGYAIECDELESAGTRAVHLIDDVLSQNAAQGLFGINCSVSAVRTTFSENGVSGVAMTDSNATFDRCTFSGNGQYGASFDGGLFSVANSFIFRNGIGIYALPSQPGSVIAFNTVVDNTLGVSCNASAAAPVTFSNDIIVRNTTNTSDNVSCTYPNSILMADAAPLRFVHPDAPPYDYHITAGSLAIDQATSSMVDHDFDGEARPRGNGRDIGADEAQ